MTATPLKETQTRPSTPRWAVTTCGLTFIWCCNESTLTGVLVLKPWALWLLYVPIDFLTKWLDLYMTGFYFIPQSKPFVLLHPTSIFANHSNLLKPAEVPEKHAGHIDLKGHLSTKHELLAYGWDLLLDHLVQISYIKAESSKTYLYYYIIVNLQTSTMKQYSNEQEHLRTKSILQ